MCQKEEDKHCYLRSFVDDDNELLYPERIFKNDAEQKQKSSRRRMSIGDNLFNGFSPTKTAVSGIQEFVETTIVLRKDKNNELGISVTGGCDTYLLRLFCILFATDFLRIEDKSHDLATEIGTEMKENKRKY